MSTLITVTALATDPEGMMTTPPTFEFQSGSSHEEFMKQFATALGEDENLSDRVEIVYPANFSKSFQHTIRSAKQHGKLAVVYRITMPSVIDVTAVSYYESEKQVVTFKFPNGGSREKFMEQFALALGEEQSCKHHVEWKSPNGFWSTFDDTISSAAKTGKLLVVYQFSAVAIFGISDLSGCPPSAGYKMVLCTEDSLSDPQFSDKYRAALWFATGGVTSSFKNLTIPTFIGPLCDYAWQFCDRHVKTVTATSPVPVQKEEKLECDKVDNAADVRKSVVVIGKADLISAFRMRITTAFKGVDFMYANLFGSVMDRELETNFAVSVCHGRILLVDHSNPCVVPYLISSHKPNLVVTINDDLESKVTSFCSTLSNPIVKLVAVVGSKKAHSQMIAHPIDVPGISFVPCNFEDYESYSAFQGVVRIFGEAEDYNLIKDEKLSARIPLLNVDLRIPYKGLLEKFCKTRILLMEKPAASIKVGVYGKKELYDTAVNEVSDHDDMELIFCNRLSDAVDKFTHIVYLREEGDGERWWQDKLKSISQRYQEIVVTKNIPELIAQFSTLSTIEPAPKIDHDDAEDLTIRVGSRVLHLPGEVMVKEVDCICRDGTLVLKSAAGTPPISPVLCDPNICIPLGEINPDLKKHFVGRLVSYKKQLWVIMKRDAVDITIRSLSTHEMETVKLNLVNYCPQLNTKCRGCCKSIIAWKPNESNFCKECINIETNLTKIRASLLEAGLRKVFRDHATFISLDNSQVFFDRDDATKYYKKMIPHDKDMFYLDQFLRRLGKHELVSEQEFVDFYLGCLKYTLYSMTSDFKTLDFFQRYCGEPEMYEFMCCDLVLTKSKFVGTIQSKDEKSRTVKIAYFGNTIETVTVTVKDIVHFHINEN